MNKTTVGLPNSCCECGKDVIAECWHSENDDMARSGQGFCESCANPKPSPKRRVKRKKVKPVAKLVTITDSAKDVDTPVTPDVFPKL